MSPQYLVIGLGLFGRSMLENLLQIGHDVVAIDNDGERIRQLENEGLDAHLVTADATEANVLQNIGAEHFDGAVVATGNLAVNVFATMILTDLGVSLVMARVHTEKAVRVLKQVGADSVVQPEKEFGAVASRRLVYPRTLEYLELGDGEAVVEVEVPNEWVGKSLSDLHLYREWGEPPPRALEVAGQAWASGPHHALSILMSRARSAASPLRGVGGKSRGNRARYGR